MKKYQIQEHVVKIVDYFVYELAPNGEVCRRVCVCRDKRDAEEVFRLLSEYAIERAGNPNGENQ